MKEAQMYRKIVVPLDGSPLGERALPLAVELARRTGATLHLVHVHLPVMLPAVIDRPIPDSELDSDLYKQMVEMLSILVTRLQAVANVPIETKLIYAERNTSIAANLESYAKEIEADLLVMTTHGRSGFGRMWLGSVADELIRTLSLPILLVRPDEQLPAFDERWRLDRTLVSVNGTSTSESILPHAKAFAKIFESETVLLRIVEPVILSRYAADATLVQVDQDLLDQTQAEARAYLDRIAQEFGEQKVIVRDVVDAQVALALLDAAEKHEVGMIAMATHGRQGLNRLLVGSVADKVLRSANVPLLVYRPESD
jgi:nucleotide-binding universal stress UspA family protein